MHEAKVNRRELAAWVAEEYKKIEEYLGREGIDPGGLGAKPVFRFYPYLAVWALEAGWAIGGDVPNDFVATAEAGDARTALRVYASRWREVAEMLLSGNPHPRHPVAPEAAAEEGRLLLGRVDYLGGLAEEDGVWEKGKKAARRTCNRRTNSKPKRQL